MGERGEGEERTGERTGERIGERTGERIGERRWSKEMEKGGKRKVNGERTGGMEREIG